MTPTQNPMTPRLEKPGLDSEKLREFLSQQYEQHAQASAAPETAGTPADPPASAAAELLEFHLKPEELVSYLDEYVIEQAEAKAVLATKICTHFNRLKLPPEDGEQVVGNIKNNILMVGPTGVGKTFLIKLIAEKLCVPFVKADATKFSETGYVGGDVEDLVRELVAEADGDIELAQHGIIYIDEIDKIASSTANTTGPDVSRSGVQRNLLKLMEHTEVDLRSPHDISSQMESVIQMQRTGGKAERKKVSTGNVLFVVSGAFSGLEEIIGRRLNRGSMGFRLPEAQGESEEEGEDTDFLKHLRSEDLIEYGFESEFIGRLPVTAVLSSLECSDLLEILRSPRCSVILSKKRDFRAYGIDVDFTDDALSLLAQSAYEERTGARGLVSAVERVLLAYECKLPSVDIDSFTVTAEVVDQPEEELQSLLLEGSLHTFVRKFRESHNLGLSFDDDAVLLVKEMAVESGEMPLQLCERLLADYGHGLKLLEFEEFKITADVLRDPSQSLNDLIKSLYHGQT